MMKRFIGFIGLLFFIFLIIFTSCSDHLIKKAMSGDAEAQYLVGKSYYDGKGVKQDYNEAFRWFKASAEQGHAYDQCNLGLSYSNGLGVKKDNNEAYR